MNPSSNPSATVSRRTFLRTGSLVAAGAWLARPGFGAAAPRPLFAKIGIAAPMAQAAALREAGIDFLTEGVDRLLVPDQPEETFVRNLATLAAAPLPVLACNNFIRPAHLRSVGADANHEAVLAWADTTFARAKRAGAKFIVFGSSGSRAIRDNWPRDKAEAQFRELLTKMGPLAERQDITVAIEQLRAQECNFINHLAEGAAMIRSVGHPRVRLLADLFHMVSMDDTPADLKAAMDVVVHVEIAEKTGRAAPGVNGQDFRPFFKVLKDANYTGALNIEGTWQVPQIAPSLAEIRKQASEA